MELPRDIVLSAHAVSKLYARRTAATRKRLASATWRALFGLSAPEIDTPRASEFWALDDISFELERGKALEIIGLNGSGKTTLLRILAGQILPDRGEVRVNGTSAAMIDLQAGFQPAASGRENIYLRAAALGFTRKQTQAMIDEIIAFAEIGDAIDAPVTTYSAGMKMRLAFSVMAMVQPDVLLIDEVLAVGDFRFRQKSLARIREMRSRSAFVFVSHSMGDVAQFCDRVLVLHKGQIVFGGMPDPAIAFYQALEQDSKPTKAPAKMLIPASVNRPDLLDNLSFRWNGADADGAASVREGEPLQLRVSFTMRYKPRRLVVGVPLYDQDGNVLTGFATDASGVDLVAEAGDRVELEMTAPRVVFNPGRYRAAIGITDGTEFLYMDHLPDMIVKNAGRQSWGTVSVPCEWRASVTTSAASQNVSAQ